MCSALLVTSYFLGNGLLGQCEQDRAVVRSALLVPHACWVMVYVPRCDQESAVVGSALFITSYLLYLGSATRKVLL